MWDTTERRAPFSDVAQEACNDLRNVVRPTESSYPDGSTLRKPCRGRMELHGISRRSLHATAGHERKPAATSGHVLAEIAVRMPSGVPFHARWNCYTVRRDTVIVG
jgi:hypothetical protein